VFVANSNKKEKIGKHFTQSHRCKNSSIVCQESESKAQFP